MSGSSLIFFFTIFALALVLTHNLLLSLFFLFKKNHVIVLWGRNPMLDIALYTGGLLPLNYYMLLSLTLVHGLLFDKIL